jgi:hypothetical protein
MSTLESLIPSLRAEALALTHQSSIEDEAYPFMMGILDLGLLLEAEPSLRADIRRFLDETAAHFDRELGIIRRFASDIESRSWTGWSDNPALWEDLCTRRSAVAFFAELYEDTELAPMLPSLDEARLDGIMRDHARDGYLPQEDIPAHMPKRHWWWWLPDDPPA